MHHLVHQVFVHLAVSQGHVSPFIPLFCDARSDNMIIWQQTHYQLHAVLCMKSNCEANINNSGVRLASCGFTMKSFAVTSKCIVFLYNYQPSTSWNGIISFKKILQLLCGDTECFSKRKYLDYDDVLTQSCFNAKLLNAEQILPVCENWMFLQYFSCSFKNIWAGAKCFWTLKKSGIWKTVLINLKHRFGFALFEEERFWHQSTTAADSMMKSTEFNRG